MLVLQKMLGGQSSLGALGKAIGRIIPLLENDESRLAFALSLVTRLDLYEAIPTLLSWLRDSRNPKGVLAAAKFYAHPALPEPIDDAIQLLGEATTFNEQERDVYAIRVDPGSPVQSDVFNALKAEAWPGLYPAQRSPLFVALHASSGRGTNEYSMATNLVSAGAMLKRIPHNVVRGALKGWFREDIPLLVGPSVNLGELARVLNVSSLVGLVPTSGEITHIEQPELIDRINGFLPRSRRLEFAGRPPHHLPSPPDLLHPSTLLLGALDTHEVAFLTGVRRNSIRYLKDQESLRPRKVGGTNYWSFAQVVGMRVWQFFRSQTPSRISPRIAEKLVRYAEAAESRIIGVTASGDVLVRDNGHLVNALTNQLAEERVVLMDRVFKPFQLGGGYRLPDLATPSDHTQVNPNILGGTPIVKERRIGARSIHLVFQDGVRGGGNGVKRVLDTYPELTASEATDAALIGAQVASAR